MSGEDPLSAVEGLAQSNDWQFERDEEGISMDVAGRWAQYRVAFSWMPENEIIHLSCGFEFRPVPHRQNEVKELIALINRNLWVGHFDLWLEDNLLMFRHGFLFSGDTRLTPEQCHLLMQTALQECEKYYPAFNFVLWAGKTAAESLAAVDSLSDVQGEA